MSMRKGSTLSISDSSSSPTAGATRRRRRDQQQQDHQNHEQGEVQQERAVVRGAPPTSTSAEVIQGHHPSSRGPLNKRIKHDQQLQQHLLMSSSLSSSPCSKINITTFPFLEEKHQQYTNHETSKILGDEAKSAAATPNYHKRIGTSGSGGGNPYIHAGTNTSSTITGPTILSNTSPGRQKVVSSTSKTPSSRLNILPSDPPQISNRVVPLSLSSSSVPHGRYSPTAEGRRLSSLHDGHFSLSTTNPSSSSSPQPSPAAGRRNPRKLPLRTDVSSVENSAFVAVGSNNHLPQQQGSLSSTTNTGISAGQHLPGGQRSSSLAGSILNADYHQSLVSAIFEIGLIEGSPLSIYENMSTRIKDSYSDFNLEKIKSKLQKYRKFKSKNKEEFMQVYHKTLEDMLTAFPIPGSSSASASQTPLSLSSTMIPLSILENLSSGEVAAHLTYEVMKEDAWCIRMESNSSCDDIEVKHQQDEKQVKSHVPLSDRSSPSSLEKFLRNGNGSHSNKKFRAYSDASLLQQATNVFGDTLDFPTLTPDEHKSFIGKAFQHFLGLLSSLTCDIYEQRQAGAGGGNSISSEAGLTIASGGIPTSFAQQSWAAANINDPFGSNSTSMMSMPFISTTPIMAAMNEWSAPPFILLNPSHYPLSNWHQHHQHPQQDQQEPPVSLQGDEQKHHHPSALSLHLSSSSSSILAKSDEAGAALLAGLSVAPVGNEEVAHLSSSHQQYSSGSTRRDHYHNKDDQEQENDNTPKASNKSTFY